MVSSASLPLENVLYCSRLRDHIAAMRRILEYIDRNPDKFVGGILAVAFLVLGWTFYLIFRGP